MNEVLLALCRHCVSIMDGWVPYPATVMSKAHGWPYRRTLNELHKLEEAGYVRLSTITTGEYPLPIRGWTITKKAKKTDEYNKAYEKEREIVLDVFGWDIVEESKNGID